MKQRAGSSRGKNDGLSQRDRYLARIEELLAEELAVSLPDDHSGKNVFAGPAEPVDLKLVIDGVSLPSKSVQVPKAPPTASPSLESNKKAPSKGRFSIFQSLVQIFILLFVLTWVFLAGILVGRGHLWKSGLGHEVVTWVEQAVGWADSPEPIVTVENNTAQQEDSEFDPGTDENDQEEADSIWLTPNSLAEENETPDPWESSDDQFTQTAGSADGSDYDSSSAADQSTYASGEAEPSERPATVTNLAESAGGPESSPAENHDLTALAGDRDQDPDPAPSAAALAGGNGKFAVQVASAMDEQEAQKRVEKLERQGFSAYFYKSANGRYPVRVGRFVTHQEANMAKVKLEMLGYKKPYVSKLTD